MWSFTKWAIKGGIVCYSIHEHLLFTTKSNGTSMLPTFNYRGDVLLCEALSKRFDRLEKGDVVICTSPRDPHKLVIKRIIGMGGETVLHRRMSDFWGDACISTDIPVGSVWLQGDNLSDSIDSRTYGPVPIALIKGRVIFKIWPYFEMRGITSTLEYSDKPAFVDELSQNVQRRIH